jgi:pimeloyl-ACP methyl ester carboxylesterase
MGVSMRVPHADAGSEARIVDTARGRLVVWDTPGPVDAPTLVLLHGVTLDAATNWSGAVATLAQHFRVLALDLRGHGGGPPARVPYRLEDCADDVAAVVRALGTGPVIVAGYSMGGMIAQLFWRRHPELTAGLVLCATARNVSGSFLEQLTAMTMPFVVGALGWIPPVFPLSADLVGTQLLGDALDPRVRRAVLARMRRMPLVTALAAMQAACDFSSHRWIGGVDVPTAVLVTRHDSVVPPSRQMRLARALPGAEVVEVDGDHDVFLAAPGAFAHALTAACLATTSPQSRPDGTERAS